jgi:hypothetical protein
VPLDHCLIQDGKNQTNPRVFRLHGAGQTLRLVEDYFTGISILLCYSWLQLTDSDGFLR